MSNLILFQEKKIKSCFFLRYFRKVKYKYKKIIQTKQWIFCVCKTGAKKNVLKSFGNHEAFNLAPSKCSKTEFISAKKSL